MLDTRLFWDCHSRLRLLRNDGG